MQFETDDIVLAILHSPREKLFGILGEINATGLTIRAIELGYFDDWCKSIADGEAYLPMTEQFIPMWRIERITRDGSTGEIPSLADQFESRTGRSLRDQ